MFWFPSNVIYYYNIDELLYWWGGWKLLFFYKFIASLHQGKGAFSIGYNLMDLKINIAFCVESNNWII